MLAVIFWLIVLLIVLALVLYVVDLLPIPGSDPRIKSLIKALVVLMFIVLLLRVLGVFGGPPYIRL